MEDLSTFMTSVTGALSDFTTDTLGTIIVAALTASTGLVIGWFAYRFIKRRVVKAMTKGSL